jgi:signal transduction histidine kinase
MQTRGNIAYRLLVAVWVLIMVWQVMEHHRVTDAARSAVIRRARDITGTLGLFIRSQRRFGGIVAKPRLESMLNELVKSDELKAVALLNAASEVVASAGDAIDFGGKGLPSSGVHWDKTTVTVVNPVDLGANLQADGSNAPPTIVLPEDNPRGGRRENWRPPPGPWPRRDGTNVNEQTNSPSNVASATPPDRPPEMGPPPEPGGPADPGRPPGPDRPPDRRPGFRRPPWMTEEEYKTLIEQKGLHGLAVVLSAEAYRAARTHDLWLRAVIAGFATISVIGFGLAWRNLIRSSEFQMRLVRASELNSHLREMNVAAAGLAHETRNPLNIIRGLAQMIAKNSVIAEDVRKESLAITEEVDRVTVQLNEYINYSKPREVRRSPVAISPLISDVVNTLKSDLEDKSIQLELVPDTFSVNADQQLLRQLVFNLLINAIQAVDKNGQIQIVTRKTSAGEASFEVRDNGPGVPPEQRDEIFRPYFTTRAKGTGLGLAVVKQIVMAHGWEVECLPNNGKGAAFRVSRLELSAAS